MILVVSHPADDHAAGVLAALERDGHPAMLFDTSHFPSGASLIQRFEHGHRDYEYAVDGRRIDLNRCRVAWWRRPQPFTLVPGIAPGAVQFTHTECYEAMAGLWAALDVIWVNKPELDEIAHHKPYQLAAATEVGLPIPRTLITNDPDAARRLIDDLGPERTVYKTFLASEDCWRETRLLRKDELALLDRVRLAPVIFQEFVPAVADVRVTVMGDTLFATSITPPPGGYEVDYRLDMHSARVEPTTLPAGTQRQIRALMKRLGLVYGAIDLRQTPENRFVFLEINPAGEWRFVEDRTGQPMTDAMAALLVELDGR